MYIIENVYYMSLLRPLLKCILQVHLCNVYYNILTIIAISLIVN